jgi:hypothetical protein
MDQNSSHTLSDEENGPSRDELHEKDPNLVEWDVGDPENPRNWSNGRKFWITFLLGMLALAASMGSSIISPAEKTIAAYVGVSSEVAVLSVSLYMYELFPDPAVISPHN